MTITINGNSYQVPFPIGVTMTHEGGLDQASITIKHIGRKEPFEPFTRVKFLDQWWVISSDEVVEELFAGKCTHTIMLIEASKELERIVCGAKTYTRPLKTEYTPVNIRPSEEYTTYLINNESIPGAIVSPDVSWESPCFSNKIFVDGKDVICWNYRDDLYVLGGTSVQYKLNDGEYEDVPANGEYISVEYGDVLSIKYRAGSTRNQTLTPAHSTTIYTIYCLDPDNDVIRNPLSVFDVVSRFLTAAEPIRSVDNKRFVHTVYPYSTDYVNTKNIQCPEIYCENCSTLKEQLDQFAKILHAKTKLSFSAYGEGIVEFEPLVSLIPARIKGTRISAQYVFDPEKYAGRIQTNAANLVVNNKDEGTMIEPLGECDDGEPLKKTLRCSDEQARINEETGEIETTLPIRRITKLIVQHPESGESIDVTKYVNEEAIYLALSSYSGEQGKSYSLFYRQGQCNIKGLFFKVPNAISPALSEYAINNIWNEAGGISDLSATDYKDLLAYVEYEPFLNMRLVNSRTDGKGGLITYVANQAANEMDKDALGDFVRGTAEQMSSAGQHVSYIFKSLSDVPKVGTMFDKNNVISAISYEIYPYFVKATLTLSEHYNRYGQHVDVPSAVRQYEIDVNNVRDRSVLYTDVCTITTKNVATTDDTMLTSAGKQRIVSVACNGGSLSAGTSEKASVAEVGTLTEELKPLTQLSMPVNSFSFGNSLVFFTAMKDNYSAGSYATDGKSGYNLQNYAAYSDSYGTADLLSLRIYSGYKINGSLDRVSVGRKVPLTVKEHVTPGIPLIDTAQNSADNPYIRIYKDSRERILLTYQVLFQSTDGIIIGKAFADMCPMVKSYKNVDSVDEARLVLFGDGEDAPYLDHIKGAKRSEGHDEDYNVKLNRSSYYAIDFDYVGSLPSHSAWAIFRGNNFILGANHRLTYKTLFFHFSHT